MDTETQKMLHRLAFLRECAEKEGEDAFANGGRESYNAVVAVYERQIDEEWEQFQQSQQKGDENGTV